MSKRALGFMNKGSSFDPDAKAFIDAAVLTDTTQKNAINTLVIDLKANSLWTKFKIIYPFIGGTSAKHKWNLKDPRDLDAAFRIVWTDPGGYVIHSSTGVRGTADVGAYYGGTFFKDSNFNIYNQIHISKYTQYYTSSWDVGNINVSPNSRMTSFLTQTYYQLHGNLNLITCDNSGLFIANRSSSTSTQLYVNNLIKANLTDNVVGGSNTLPYAILSQWSDGISNNSTAEWRFCSFGDSMTEAEALIYYNIVQAYQTTLGRQV